MHTDSRITTSRIAATVVAIAILLTACGSSSKPAAAKDLIISGAWARTSATSQTMGAVYLKVENPNTTADAITKAAVASSVAAKAELHETVAADASASTTMMGATTTAMGATTTAMGASTTAMGGVMQMKPVGKIDVPANGMVELKPGGFHIMLIDLVKPLVKGDKIDVTLTFASGASKVVNVEVKDQP